MQTIKRLPKPCRCIASYSTQPRASTSSSGSKVYSPSTETIQSHLNTLLHPLPPLPATLAVRIATHKSFPDLRGNHNARLSFLGRRHLRCFLAMFFIRHVDALPANYMKPAVIDEALELRQGLGMRVGDMLQLEKCLRWTQIAGQTQKEFASRKESMSFWSVRGLAVESLIGGMNGYYGTAQTQHFFHARILPKLSLAPELRSAVDSTSAKAKQQLGILSSSSTSQLPSEELLNLGNDPSAEAASI